MSCYLITVGEAIATTVAAKVVKNHEDKTGVNHTKEHCESKHSISHKLGWLNKMLWGGSGLLAFEHIWHGELSPFFPFLTSASNPTDTAEMLHEMATTGTSMALLVTVVWAGLVVVTDIIERRSNVNEPIKESSL